MIGAPETLLAVEEVHHQLLYFWDTGRSTNQQNFFDTGLSNIRVLQNIHNGFERALEQIYAQLFEHRACDGLVEVDTFEQRVHLYGG